MDSMLRRYTIVILLCCISYNEGACILFRWTSLRLRLIIRVGRCTRACSLVVASLRVDTIRLTQSLLLVAHWLVVSVYGSITATSTEGRWLVALILASIRRTTNLALVTLQGLLLLRLLYLFELLIFLGGGRWASGFHAILLVFVGCCIACLVWRVETGKSLRLVCNLDGHPDRLFLRGGLVVFRSRRGHPLVRVLRRLRIVKFYHCIVYLQLIAWRGYHCDRLPVHLFHF